MEVDGSGLSCPGSSVVAEINSSEVTEGEGLRLGQDFSQVSQFVLPLRCNSALMTNTSSSVGSRSIAIPARRCSHALVNSCTSVESGMRVPFQFGDAGLDCELNVRPAV